MSNLRHFGGAAAAALATTLIAGTAQAQTPFKIGMLTAYSGEFADYGAEMTHAMQLYMKQHGDTVGGRKIEIVQKDTGSGGADAPKRLAQEAIVNDKVDMLAGFTLTPDALSVAPLATQAKKPMLIMNAATSIITSQSPYIVRFSFTLGQTASTLARWAAANGIHSVYTLVSNYGPGLNAEGSFIKYFNSAGGKIVGSDRTPFQGPDFAPFMQRVKAAKPDAVFVFVPGGDQSVAVTKAYTEAGLQGAGIRLIGTGDVTDDDVLQQMGDQALGMVTAFHYSYAHPSQLNRDFVKGMETMFGPTPRPNFVAAAAYDGMHAIYDVLARTGGKSGDQMIAAFKQEAFESPRGPLAIDPDTREPIQTIYIRRVERQDGKLVNAEFQAYPEIRDPDHVNK